MLAEPKIFPTHQPVPEDILGRIGVESLDPRFDELIPENPDVKRLWRGAEWSEGAAYLPRQDVVVWSDIPNNRMLQYDPKSGETTVFREPSYFTNGNYIDLEDRLVSAQHLAHRIARTEHDGTVTTLVDNIDGKRFNSPNDLVVKSDGTIWFTDPPYGILSNREGEQRDSDIGANYVYRFDPETKELAIVVDDMNRPNGIAFSPDEKILYVADTGGDKDVQAFDVGNDGRSLSNKRLFSQISPGATDGFRCDVKGNIWTSAADGIQCLTPDAELIGKILIPENRCANCVFGDEDFMTLYIAGDTSLYSARLAVRGARPHDLVEST